MQLIHCPLLRVLVISLVGVIPATSAIASSQKGCDKKLESQSLDQPEPKDWAGLYRLFKKFGVCDDGAIGEGFSEDVAQLFSKQWTHLDTFSRLATADKAFEQFVLRHIDATLSEDELKGMIENSTSHCPTKEKRLCSLVKSKAMDGLDELRKAPK